MWTTIKNALAWLVGSKKVMTAVIGMLAALAVKHLGFDDATATDLATKVIMVFLVLIGAQGLTDIGSGESAPQLTILGAIKNVFMSLLASRKFQSTIIGLVVMVLVKYLKIGDAFANQLANGAFALLSMLVGAQGLQDLGKTAAQAASETKAA